MYSLQFDEKALQNIEKFPKEVQERIINKLQQAKENPYHYFVKLTNREEFKLRVGEYRIIADINDSKIVILVLFANHRKKVYKRFK